MAEVQKPTQDSLFKALGEICHYGSMGKMDYRREVAGAMQVVLKQIPESVLDTATVPELDLLLDKFLGLAGGQLKGRQIGEATLRICQVIDKKESQSS